MARGLNRDDPAWLRPRARALYASTGTVNSGPSKATVYLGEALLAEVAELRLRGVDINVSNVCQTALRAAVAEAKAYTQPP